MLTFQSPSCLAVIELIPRRLPPDQLVFPSVMLGMASGTILIHACACAFDSLRMIAALLLEAGTNLLMTFETLQLGGARTERVTGGALQVAVQIRVGFG